MGRMRIGRLPSHLSEPEHSSLSSSEWQMTVLNPIVGPAANLTLLVIAELGHRGFLIAPFRHVTLQNLVFLVDRPPQVNHLPVQLHVHFVEMPAPVSETPHRAHPLPPNVARKQRPEPVPPHPYRLVANVDAAIAMWDLRKENRSPDHCKTVVHRGVSVLGGHQSDHAAGPWKANRV